MNRKFSRAAQVGVAAALVLGALLLMASAFNGNATSMATSAHPVAVEPNETEVAGQVIEAHPPAAAEAAPAPATAKVVVAPPPAIQPNSAPVVAAGVKTPPPCVPVTNDGPGLRLMSVGCGRPVVFFLPALGSTAADRSHPNLEAVFQGLVDAGNAVVATDGVFNSWGNPAAVEGLHNLVNQYSPNSAPRILAMSMGNTVLLNYGAKYQIHSAAALIPVTTWTLEILVRSGLQPLLPVSVSYPYAVWQGAEDIIVGLVNVLGATVTTIPGGHDINLAWPVADVVRALV